MISQSRYQKLAGNVAENTTEELRRIFDPAGLVIDNKTSKGFYFDDNYMPVVSVSNCTAPCEFIYQDTCWSNTCPAWFAICDKSDISIYYFRSRSH